MDGTAAEILRHRWSSAFIRYFGMLARTGRAHSKRILRRMRGFEPIQPDLGIPAIPRLPVNPVQFMPSGWLPPSTVTTAASSASTSASLPVPFSVRLHDGGFLVEIHSGNLLFRSCLPTIYLPPCPLSSNAPADFSHSESRIACIQ